nr:site-specific integrase [uncultured Holophaga sp.]
MLTTFKNGLAKHESGTYHYCFRLNGKQYKGSTRATDMVTARKVLEEKRREALLGKPVLTGSVMTVSDLVAEWVRTHERTVSWQHQKSVRDVAKNWIVPSVGRKPFGQVTTGMVADIRNAVLEKGLKPATANHVLRVVSLLWNYAVDAGYLEALPFKVKPLRIQKQPRAIVPATSLKRFLAAVDQEAQNQHVRVILRVMIGLGLRESEALGMRWEWFDIPNQTYTVGKAKGKEARVLPVPSWLMQSILEMPKPQISEWVFPSALDGKPHRAQFCKKVLQRVCAKLKLGNVTQHRLRATFASLHAEAGTPVTEIQGMLGHKNIATTMIYVETSLDAKRKAQDALSLKLGLA